MYVNIQNYTKHIKKNLWSFDIYSTKIENFIILKVFLFYFFEHVRQKVVFLKYNFVWFVCFVL